MRLHRFLVDFQLENSAELTDKELVHQIKNVLKLKSGESLVLFNESGESAEVKILGFSKDIMEYEISDFRIKRFEKKRKVILACSIVKRDNFEWIAQKATEVGVDEIVPLFSQHSVKLGLQTKRLEKIMKEAVEQCGRFKVPKLHGITKFEEALRLGDEKTLKIIFEAKSPKISSENMKDKESVIVFVGPEGGWAENELSLAKKYGCISFSLQNDVMRTETAAVVGSYLVSNF